MSEIKGLYDFLMQAGQQILSEKGLLAIMAVVLIGYFLWKDHNHTQERIELNRQRASFEEQLVSSQQEMVEVQKDMADIARADAADQKEFLDVVAEIVRQRDKLINELMEQRKLLAD